MNNIQRADVTLLHGLWMTKLHFARHTPAGRPTEIRYARENKIQFFPRLGGLHHRYAVAARYLLMTKRFCL